MFTDEVEVGDLVYTHGRAYVVTSVRRRSGTVDLLDLDRGTWQAHFENYERDIYDFDSELRVWSIRFRAGVENPSYYYRKARSLK